MDEGGIRGSYSLYRDYIGYINTTSKYFGKATKAIKSHQRGRRKLCDLVCVNNCYWGFESFFCCNHPKRTTHNMYVATSSFNLTEIVLSPTRLRMVVSPIKISMTKELVIVHSLIHHLAFVPPWCTNRTLDKAQTNRYKSPTSLCAKWSITRIEYESSKRRFDFLTRLCPQSNSD